MRGDFTRFGFRPAEHFSGVYMQQGRVQLDSDWNEQSDILSWLDRLTRRDVVGAAGTPKLSPALQVTLSPDKTDLLFTPGDVYVNGLLWELRATTVVVSLPAATQIQFKSIDLDGDILRAGDWLVVWDAAAAAAPQVRKVALVDPAANLVTVNEAIAAAAQPRARRVHSFRTQRQLPGAALPLPNANRTDLLYLDVWERHVSAVEDPELREVALGGPDTATRVQTVLQVKVVTGVNAADCSAPIANWPPAASAGRLSARVQPVQDPASPCSILAGGGYKGLENRLYRVEIHGAGDIGAATFKWSRDNGSLAFPVESFVGGAPAQIIVKQLSLDRTLALRKGDWVEVTTDERELPGDTGILTQIVDLDEARRLLVLGTAVNALAGQTNPRVRRWDQKSDAVLVQAAEFDLEDGIKIQFTGSGFKKGDWWAFAARTETGTIETLAEAPPQGTAHSYARLALVAWQAGAGGVVSAAATPCLPKFPPLTAIAASDVSYDNNVCKFPNSKTVQDALDRLCAERDLRFHNKHLHGWGVVCGLEVYCGGPVVNGKRAGVRVQPGYAVDCEGNDIRLTAERVLNVLDLIAAYQAAHPNSPLLDQAGDGDVTLVIDAPAGGQIQFAVQPHKPKKSLMDFLEGTVWADVMEKCIEPLRDFWKEQFTQPKDSKALVSPGEMRFIALVNLLYQTVNKLWGPNVYLSQAEHDLLEQVYKKLRDLLRSKTYCSMFDNARPFPDYPFKDSAATTMFGKEGQIRARHSPKADLLVTIAGDERIFVYNTKAKELRIISEFPAKGAAVKDVAFSADGKTLHAIGVMGGGKGTLWASAAIAASKLTWDAPLPVCDAELVSLATHPTKANVFYAVGKGKGIYELAPPNLPAAVQPKYGFQATGHIEIADVGNTVQIFATESLPGSPDQYELLFTAPLSGNNLEGKPNEPVRLKLPGPGKDGIAVTQVGAAKTRVLVGLEPAAGGAKSKRLAVFALGGAAPQVDIVQSESWQDTDLVLAAYGEKGGAVVARQDHFRLDTFEKELETDVYPLQVMPSSIATDPSGSTLYVVNTASRTVTVIPAAELAKNKRISLEQLAAYRGKMLEAYMDLLGGFLQYLKDCLCDRMLIKCPACDADDVVKLAVVSVRANAVDRVCNFSERRFVKSFPTVEYWLSLVPILPALRAVVEYLCCLALPNLFAKYQAAPAAGGGAAAGVTMTGTQMMVMQKTLAPANLKYMWSDQTAKFKGVMGLTGTILQTQATAPPPKPEKAGVKHDAVVNQQVDKAVKSIEAREGSVLVKKLDPKQGLREAAMFAGQPSEIPPGSRVTLYEKDGVVKYYSIAREEVGPANEELAAELSKVKRDVQAGSAAAASETAGLRAELAAQKALLAERDRQVAELGQKVTEAQKMQERIDTLERARVKDLQDLDRRDTLIATLRDDQAKLAQRITGEMDEIRRTIRPTRPPG